MCRTGRTLHSTQLVRKVTWEPIVCPQCEVLTKGFTSMCMCVVPWHTCHLHRATGLVVHKQGGANPACGKEFKADQRCVLQNEAFWAALGIFRRLLKFLSEEGFTLTSTHRRPSSTSPVLRPERNAPLLRGRVPKSLLELLCCTQAGQL